MDSLPAGVFQEILKSAGAFTATRYLAGKSIGVFDLGTISLIGYLVATGLICIIYDHILTFDIEVSVIWFGDCPTVTKAMYIMSRYMIEGLLITVSYCESRVTARYSMHSSQPLVFGPARPLIHQSVRLT